MVKVRLMGRHSQLWVLQEVNFFLMLGIIEKCSEVQGYKGILFQLVFLDELAQMVMFSV